MKDENIPPSLKIALDVEDSEYRKAKLQATALWTATMTAPLVGLLLWSVGVRVTGWLVQAIALGVGTYAVLYGLLPHARKMSTMRMKKYKELMAFRAAREKVQAREELSKPG